MLSVSDVNINLISEKLNEDLANVPVSDWMSSNKLSLNTSKTEYMIVGLHKILKQIDSDPLIALGDFPIQRVKVTKSLGVMVDEALTWSDHVDFMVTKKVNKGLNILREFLILYVNLWT